MEIADAAILLAVAGMGGWGAVRLTRLYFQFRRGKWVRRTTHLSRQDNFRVVVYLTRTGYDDIEVGRLDIFSPTFTEDLAALESKADETCAALNVAERRV